MKKAEKVKKGSVKRRRNEKETETQGKVGRKRIMETGKGVKKLLVTFCL